MGRSYPVDEPTREGPREPLPPTLPRPGPTAETRCECRPPLGVTRVARSAFARSASADEKAVPASSVVPDVEYEPRTPALTPAGGGGSKRPIPAEPLRGGRLLPELINVHWLLSIDTSRGVQGLQS